MSDQILLESPATNVPSRPEKNGPPERAPKGARPRATAETLAQKQRDISVSEFFAKNRHLLGFDNPRKALLTTVKEAVDNSLDACEEAGIAPDIIVAIEDLSPPDAPANAKSSRYRVTVVDNGPGIVRRQVENIFGRLLYGSKFHRLKMSRGQQGIGISAAGMYGLITTGRPMVIHTKPEARKPAHHIELAMNTKTNRAEVTEDVETDDFPPARVRALGADSKHAGVFDTWKHATGTSVSIELEARYQKGRSSVDEFLDLTAIANPHARIVFIPPSRESSPDDDDTAEKRPKLSFDAPPPAGTASPADGAQVRTEERAGITIFPRAVSDLPPETKEIQPHPRGIELGILLQMLKESGGGSLFQFLQDSFCRVSPATAAGLCQKIGVTSRTRVSDIDHPRAERLYREFQAAKLPPPPTDCLAPIGVRQLLAGLLKGVRAEFYAASTRDAAIYRGRPFQVEAAIAFGGELPADEPARVIRFANRVPLLYQQSACSSFKAVVDTNWRNYDLQQPRASIPIGPIVVMIHMASVWVPFTSESKEAIADYDEIRKEMRLALMECGRKLGTYLRKRQKMRREGERRDIFERYIGEIATAVNAITGTSATSIHDALLAQAKKRTAIADLQLDDEGRAKSSGETPDLEGVIIVDSMAPAPALPPAPLRETARGGRGREPESPARGAALPATKKPARRAQSPSAPSEPPARVPKPRVRLVDGRMVPVDHPGLFDAGSGRSGGRVKRP